VLVQAEKKRGEAAPAGEGAPSAEGASA